MTRILFLIVGIFISLSTYADYRIVFLNTPTIKINGKSLKVNDVFHPSASVEWTSPKQAMKIVDSQRRATAAHSIPISEIQS